MLTHQVPALGGLALAKCHEGIKVRFLSQKEESYFLFTLCSFIQQTYPLCALKERDRERKHWSLFL